MDITNLMISFFFGMIGMGMFMYGKKAGQMVALGAGLALMVLPYCIPNPIALCIVCTLITASPFVIRTG